MAKFTLRTDIQDFLRLQSAAGQTACSPEDITANVDASRPTVNRYLARMVAAGELRKLGAGPATRYALPDLPPPASATRLEVREPAPLMGTPSAFSFSADRQPVIEQLTAPIGTRPPIAYQRAFVDAYLPNRSCLLPPALADELFAKGKAQGQQPAGTYARKVLEQLLIDLSWHSSRLEGNRKSLLDTAALFAKGRTDGEDVDSLMLLNHKDAIEFVVDAVPEYGITDAVVRNIQALLMQGLLANPEAVGAIRRTVVNITDSVYLPAQMPNLLEEMLGLLVAKAREIKNPIEAAFFLWINLAYLQPFEDGNKRTSRLCANLPLLLQNCAPLSFLDVEPPDYAMAVLAVYEKQDVSLAVELFAWTYRRSIAKYAVVLESMGNPDAFRAKYREHLGEAIRSVVVDGKPAVQAVAELSIAATDGEAFTAMLREELRLLAPYNCARYRVGIRVAEAWLQRGRPGL